MCFRTDKKKENQKYFIFGSVIYAGTRAFENKGKLKKSGIQQGIEPRCLSQTLLPSEPLDSSMADECRIVLIPKLASITMFLSA